MADDQKIPFVPVDDLKRIVREIVEDVYHGGEGPDDLDLTDDDAGPFGVRVGETLTMTLTITRKKE